jgi:hypothetical protein
MVTWILGTLSLELHEIVREPTETARQAWLAIEAQFLGNNESRVLQLDARFRAFKQGDLSVRDYRCRMKGIADDLRALGEIVTDRHLVLNLLQGLNKKFDHMKIFIKRWQPFPSFHTVCNDLELEEIELDHSAAHGQSSTFYSAPSGGGHPPQQLPPGPPPQEPLCPTTYLLNHLPTKAISTTSPYFALHGVAPSYKHLRVFGCDCYPNLSVKAAYKLASRSIRCIFLRYFTDHKGYRCLIYSVTLSVVV